MNKIYLSDWTNYYYYAILYTHVHENELNKFIQHRDEF